MTLQLTVYAHSTSELRTQLQYLLEDLQSAPALASVADPPAVADVPTIGVPPDAVDTEPELPTITPAEPTPIGNAPAPAEPGQWTQRDAPPAGEPAEQGPAGWTPTPPAGA